MTHPSRHLLTLAGNGQQLLLHVDRHKFGEEGKMVAGVEAMPHRKEDQGRHLADDPVVHELEPLVHIAGGPAVRVDVERLDEVAKFGGRLQTSHANIGTTGPVGLAVRLANAIIAQTGQDTDALCGQPECDVFGEKNLTPAAEQQEAD